MIRCRSTFKARGSRRFRAVADPRGQAVYAIAVRGSAVVDGVVLGALWLRRRAEPTAVRPP